MTLLDAVIKAQINGSVHKTSPPPEISEIIKIQRKRKKNKNYTTKSKVDTKPYAYDPSRLYRNLPQWISDIRNLYTENAKMVLTIHNALQTGKVDSRWEKQLPRNKQYYQNRLDSYKRIQRDNKALYKRIMTTEPRLTKASSLNEEWKTTKQTIIDMASKEFVLFPVKDEEVIEDKAFIAPTGVRRPRVYITLGIRNAAAMGTICLELFTEVCPKTCQLFLELLDGGGAGYGYVGTRLFRKIPKLYCSGGDVVYDNGFGCYAQRGRYRPIGAENYHFSHSMPGLVSMPVTVNDEVCGTFNITFKPLPQLDLRNVIIGRVVRPCNTFEALRTLGSPLSTQPIVEIVSAKRWDGKWIHGAKNTKINPETLKHLFG
ncbi:uncharacterized protein LOC126973359 isoform X2 [Leptidea sinapis]|uniref:uncharacterized protein LOC126973359 isoform X2 n=1 Tax=Leptidea sinapis TaxID=189913 RepID=UPI0021C37BE3|nr:uncharacterized protein LOC126973359 isoform X2 [Leptidea sinapis]